MENIENKNMEDNTMTNDFQELEDMRQQISLLKEKLDKESIVNDKLMRNIMSTKIGNVNSYLLKLRILIPFTMALVYFDFVILFPLSTEFMIVTQIMLVGFGIYIYLNKRLLASADIACGNLVEESKKLLCFKKREIRYIFFGMPTCVAWMVWCFYELLHCGKEQDEIICVIIGASIGAIFGFGYSIRKFRMIMRNINSVVSQIEDISTND